jgi:hypothetical protein
MTSQICKPPNLTVCTTIGDLTIVFLRIRGTLFISWHSAMSQNHRAMNLGSIRTDIYFYSLLLLLLNWFCGLVVRVPGYRSRGSEFHSRCYQIFWEAVGLERGPLRLVSATEQLLERKSSGSGLERRECGRRDPSFWTRGTLYQKKLPLTSPISDGLSVGRVRSRNKATEIRLLLCILTANGVLSDGLEEQSCSGLHIVTFCNVSEPQSNDSVFDQQQ